MKKTARIAIILTILISTLGNTPTQPARAATEVTVINADDSGPGSLRQAIADAADGGIITFAASLAGETIFLASELEIETSITIDGSNLNPRITLSGDNNANGMRDDGDAQIMTIVEGSNVNIYNIDFAHGKNNFSYNAGGIINYGSLTIQDGLFSGNSGDTGGAILNNGYLTVQNGVFTGNEANQGGAIFNFGTLVMENSVISNNSADIGGGVFNMGALEITGSNIFENSADTGGGGVANSQEGNTSGTLTITNSTISMNTSDAGGGILNFGEVTISNSTISNNTVSSTGGGVSNFSTATIINSTIFGNSAEYGGGTINFGPLTMTNNTFSGNSAVQGGGLYNGGSLNFVNNILADSSTGEDCFNEESNGIIGANTNNLIESNASSPSQCGVPTITADPNLAPLADNGGPTQTMALLPGSPAIDAGDGEACTETDQRGVARPQNGDNDSIATCDIGAYEYEYIEEQEETTPPTVDMFTVPTSSHSLDIPITDFTASDNVGVTGYLITTSAEAPANDVAGWALTAPTTFTVAGNGTYTLHPWAKDAAGNVSALFETPPTVEVDTALPSILSITRAGDNPTAAASVDFTVTFSKPVTNVDVDDFYLTTDGVIGAVITGVTGSGNEYTVTVNTGTGSGTIRLDVLTSADITDLAENLLAGLPYEDSETYDIQKSVGFRSIAAQDG